MSKICALMTNKLLGCCRAGAIAFKSDEIVTLYAKRPVRPSVPSSTSMLKSSLATIQWKKYLVTCYKNILRRGGAGGGDERWEGEGWVTGAPKCCRDV
jgi:hypothetical protein